MQDSCDPAGNARDDINPAKIIISAQNAPLNPHKVQ